MSARAHERRPRGFTLLEVMIAVAILALALLAIGTADGSSILNGARYHGLTTAALLMRGVVMDIEAEYQEDGFPTNSLEGRGCDVPREFTKHFKCEYDLVALEFDPAELQALVEQGVGSMMGGAGGPGAEGDDEEKPKEKPGKDDDEAKGEDGEKGGKGDENADATDKEFQPEGIDLSGLQQTPGVGEALGGLNLANFDPAQLLILAPLLGPDGAAIMDICQINIEQMLQKFMGMTAFFPMIVQQAADQTRKLTVRLTWDFGPTNQRTLEVTTFIVGVSEEEMEAMKTAGKLEDLQGLVSPDGGVPPSSGGDKGGGTSIEDGRKGGGK